MSTSGSYAVSGGETSSINISGGTISGKYGVHAEDTAAVNISGGTFDVSVGTINVPSYGNPNPSIQITGGNFNGDDVSQYLPDPKNRCSGGKNYCFRKCSLQPMRSIR